MSSQSGKKLDEFDVVIHDGDVCITPDDERIVRLARVRDVKREVDDDIAALLS